MILDLRKTCAASSMISWLSLDSAIFSLNCLIPVPPVFGGPFLSMTLSHSLLDASPSLSAAQSSLITSNSPRKRASLFISMEYRSILSRSWFIPGTVSTRPSKEAEIWNSLKIQAATQPVVARERPTWSLMITGQLMAVPTKVSTKVSKSVSVGEAELQVGILMWTNPEKVSLTDSNFGESEKIFDFNLFLPLVDVHHLDLATTIRSTFLHHLLELDFVSFDFVSGDVSEFCILSDLVWRSGTDGFSADVDVWFLSHVDPDDLAILGVDGATHLLQDP